MSIHQSKNRIGNFTSSEIVALTILGSRKMTDEELAEYKKSNPKSQKKNIDAGFGEKALTYIDECNMERRLQLPLESESNAKPLAWGKFLEGRVFELLGLDYVLSSEETDLHPTIPYWAGSKDGIKHDDGTTIFDIKCPITRKSFCQLVDCIYKGLIGIEAMNYIRANHKDGDKYYWQLISNAVINKAKYAELIVYVPYKSELDIIREMASNFDGDQNKIAFLNWSSDSELPYLVDGGYYKNLNVIRFEVPQADKDFLTERVIEGGKLLDPEFIHPSFIEQAKELLSANEKSNVDYPAKIAEGKVLMDKVKI